MNFYLLFIVFLFAGGCNARVVPLNFKVDLSKHVNELIHESPIDEVEILGHNLPDSGQSKDSEPLDSGKDKSTVPEILNGNATNLSEDLLPKENVTDEESNLESTGSSKKSDHLEGKFNSTSEFISQNNSNSIDSFETSQVNTTLNDKIEDLKNETFVANNSSLDLEQRNNLVIEKIDQVLNDTLDQSETLEGFNNNQNETLEGFNNNQNETFETVVSETIESLEEVSNDQNETLTFEVANGTNSTNDLFELQPSTNDTKVQSFPMNAENINVSQISNLTSENLEPTNDSEQTAGGIFSGFEFLINSEVAKNAAKAMEVFNFSDPLTDHIMEENEFHSFLPAFNPAEDSDSPNQTETSEIFTNTSEVSNGMEAENNTSGMETLVTLKQADAEETETNSSVSFNFNELLDGENKTELLDSEEKFKGNVTSDKFSSPLEHTKEKILLSSTESSLSVENITSPVSNSSAVDVPKCPSPGWCLLSFLSQDACAVNEHCLGSRICCKIGCSKTCIDIESLR